jgi:hypothetical protein
MSTPTATLQVRIAPELFRGHKERAQDRGVSLTCLTSELLERALNPRPLRDSDVGTVDVPDPSDPVPAGQPRIDRRTTRDLVGDDDVELRVCLGEGSWITVVMDPGTAKVLGSRLHRDAAQLNPSAVGVGA